MSDRSTPESRRIEVQNTIVAFYKEGFYKGFECAQGGARRPPEIRFEWRGMQPVVTFDRPTVNGGGRLWMPKEPS